MAEQSIVKYTPPPDKSITHRAFMFASLARGTSYIKNPLMAEDTLSTLAFAEKIGANVEIISDEIVKIEGTGGAPRTPEDFIDCRNSGTTARIGIGLASWINGEVFLTGDSSLRKRPMDRVLKPLSKRGLKFLARKGKYLPVALKGGKVKPGKNKLNIASAQVKSALIFASLCSGGKSIIEEPFLSRDHTEKFVEFLLGKNRIKRVIKEGSHVIKLSLPSGKNLWEGFEIKVPGDPSSAAFFVFASLFGNKKLIIENLLLNPTRTRYLTILTEMGADINIAQRDSTSIEETGTIEVTPAKNTTGKYSGIRGKIIKGKDIPSLIDELPLFGAFGFLFENGIEIRDAGELRIKESDRIRAIVENLKRLNVKVEEFEDGFKVYQTPEDKIKKNVTLDGFMDHRIVMAFSALAKALNLNVKFENAEISHKGIKKNIVAISYPSFFQDIKKL